MSTQSIWSAQVKWQRILSPTCSPVVQGSGCVKNGQLWPNVCLPWQTTHPYPSCQTPVSCSSGHSGVKGVDTDVENHPFCFCFSVLVSYCCLVVSVAVCLHLFVFLFHFIPSISPSASPCLSLSATFFMSFWFFLFPSSACRPRLFFLAILLFHEPCPTSGCLHFSACLSACMQ